MILKRAIKRLWGSIRANRRRNREPKGLILLYHRVTCLKRDPQLLAVSPDHFEEHLQLLNKDFQPVALEALQDSIRSPASSRCPIAVTFDDGYRDNLLEAKPLLVKYNIPATIFVTSGQIGRQEEFWWDELERLLLGTFLLPQVLSVKIGTQTYQWSQLGSTGHSRAGSDLDVLRWSVLDSLDPTPAHRCYRELCRLVKPLCPMERASVLDSLRDQIGCSAVGRETHHCVTSQELKLLDGNGITIGAHTVNHPQLSSQNPIGQESEMRGSREALEQILDKPVHSFAYPFGSAGDYNAVTDKIARDTFQIVCANQPGVVRATSDSCELRRHLVRDWDGRRLGKEISRWLNG